MICNINTEKLQRKLFVEASCHPIFSQLPRMKMIKAELSSPDFEALLSLGMDLAREARCLLVSLVV